MARFYPLPVTAENFPDTWLLVDQCRIRAKKNRIACVVSLWAGGITLLALLLTGISGLLYEHGVAPFSNLLRVLPGFEELWMRMLWLIALGPGKILEDFLMMLMLLYWITLGVMSVFALLVLLLYRPNARPTPEGSPKENASGLLANARETMEAAARIHPTGWFCFPFAFFLAELVMLTLCIVLAGDPAPVLKQLLTPSTALNYMLLFLISVGGFVAIYGLPVYALWCFCRMWLPYAFVADIECYSIYAGEKAGKLSYQERLARRKEKAAETCRAALALERKGACPKAAAMLLEAAHGGDVSAMEHYARHCLISDSRVPAEYWLRRCVATGEASKRAKKMLRRVKMGMPVDVGFLREQTQ